jgi:hypothetical protein
MRTAVVGGGLAGLAAAIDLVDAGAEVTLYEARPTLGGAVQTLPERDDDPDPPPDNGQHIALGCFTEYLRFLDRIGESRSYLRTKLALPVIAEDTSVETIRPSLPALLAYKHLSFRDRARVPLTLAGGGGGGGGRRGGGGGGGAGPAPRRSPASGRRSADCSAASERRRNPSNAFGTCSSARP